MLPNYQTFSEVGRTGLKRWGGRIHEEFLPELSGMNAIRVYREMRENDPVVGAILFAIEMLMRQVSWRVDPVSQNNADLEAAEFLESCLEDMSQTWGDTISEILSFLVYGWSFHETVYKRRLGESRDPTKNSKHKDGRIGWRKLPIRAQETLMEWEFDESGGVQAMRQQPPPDFITRTIPMDKALLFRTRTEKGNPEGRSILRNAYRCFSSDTELLTERGWKFVGDITTSDRLATLHPETGCVEYQKPVAVWEYDYDGELIHAYSRFVDQLVTPNHRMWVRRDHKANFEFIEASDCPKSVSFSASGQWAASDASTVKVGDYDIPVSLWSPFLGFWLSEGHTWSDGVRHETGITQNEGPVADEIRRLVSQLPWSCFEQKDGKKVRWTFTRRDIHDHLAPFGKQQTRHVPLYVFEWSSSQIKELLRAYADGDGTVIGDTADGYRGTQVIYTSSKNMADDLMHLILLAGLRPAVRWQDGTGFGEGVWVVTAGKPFSNMRAKWGRKRYTGKVYCPSTNNGIVYTRRNGKCSWSGNCWYFKRRIEEIEGIGIERDLAGLPVLTPPDNLNIWDDSDPEMVRLRREAEEMVQGVRRDQMEGVVKPNGWEFSLLSTGGRRQIDVGAVIERYDRRIAMTVLADFILLGHEKVGSFALASSKTDLFGVALGAWLDSIAAVFNRYAIPRLFALNPGLPQEYLPQLKHGDIESPDLKELGAFIKDMTGVGVIIPDPELESYVRQVAHLPERMEDEE